MVLGDQVYIDRTALPPALVNRLVRLAAFQNPEFYSAQAMRLPIFDIPRIIGCAELPSHHVALPRGCRDQAEALLTSLGIGILWLGNHGFHQGKDLSRKDASNFSYTAFEKIRRELSVRRSAHVSV